MENRGLQDGHRHLLGGGRFHLKMKMIRSGRLHGFDCRRLSILDDNRCPLDGLTVMLNCAVKQNLAGRRK